MLITYSLWCRWQKSSTPWARGGGLIKWSLVAPAQLHQPCCCTVTQSCPTLCDPLNGQHASSHTQFSSVTQSCLTLCSPMDCSTPGLPVHHQLPEFTQTHVHWDSDTIQPSYPLLPSSPPAFNLSQHQGLFRWVSSSHQVAKVLEFQLQHQSFEVWTPGFCKSHFCFAFWPPIMFYQ